MLTDKEIEDCAEDQLFVHRWISIFMSKSVFYNEDYYVVRGGVVYYIHTDLTERKSGDRVIETISQCENLGIYDVAKIKREKFNYISFKKIRNKFIEKP